MQQTPSAIKRNRFLARTVLLEANLILVVPSVPSVMLERQVRERMVCVKHAKQVSIVMRSWVRRLALRVRLDGRPTQAAPSVSLARPGVSVKRKGKHVKVVSSVSIVKVKKKMPMVI